MKNKTFLIFWGSQTISLLGSMMTAFALSLWSYEQTGRALTVSLLTLCACLPYTVFAPLAGALADRLPKKPLLLIPDAVSAAGTLFALLLFLAGALRIWHLYGLNLLLGCMNALQGPAAAAAFGLLVPPGDISRAAGLRSFGDSAVTLISPVLAAALLGVGGMKVVFLCDLLTFSLAFPCVLLQVKLPETIPQLAPSLRLSLLEGARYVGKSPGLRQMIVGVAVINLFSRLTYENILTPMLLARSGSTAAASAVNSMLGLAGLLGGAAVAVDKKRRDPVKMIYGCAALSFLLGDLPMGLGRNLPVWLLAGFCASFPIPFIISGQNVLFYGTVPAGLQGRVYAFKSALQQATVPVGLLLGGLLADKVFEPMMASGSAFSHLLTTLVGTGTGSGMSVMFLCTGVLGFLFSAICIRGKSIRALARQIKK
ncbi:MAG: MFS transporter [Clostridiaceae bacterium]|nr:MFS transporter [Clostridiaceae bacterium]